MAIDSFKFTNGFIQILDEGGHSLASFDIPGSDGLYEISRDATVTPITTDDIASATGAVILVSNGEPFGVKLPLYDPRPLKDITFVQATTFVNGLTNEQLKKVIAWLLFQFREDLPDDIRDKI